MAFWENSGTTIKMKSAGATFSQNCLVQGGIFSTCYVLWTSDVVFKIKLFFVPGLRRSDRKQNYPVLKVSVEKIHGIRKTFIGLVLMQIAHNCRYNSGPKFQRWVIDDFLLSKLHRRNITNGDLFIVQKCKRSFYD